MVSFDRELFCETKGKENGKVQWQTSKRFGHFFKANPIYTDILIYRFGLGKNIIKLILSQNVLLSGLEVAKKSIQLLATKYNI